MKPIRKLAFVINEEKAGAPELAQELIAAACGAGVKVKQTLRFPLPPGYLRGYDACCVIGGDGIDGAVGEHERRQHEVMQRVRQRTAVTGENRIDDDEAGDGRGRRQGRGPRGISRLRHRRGGWRRTAHSSLPILLRRELRGYGTKFDDDERCERINEEMRHLLALAGSTRRWRTLRAVRVHVGAS